MNSFLRYLRVRLLRGAKLYPMIISFSLILVLGVGILFGNMVSTQKEDAGKISVKIGLVGDITDSYLGIGVSAVQNFDSSRLYAELISCTQEEADRMLRADELTGYAVIPDDFVQSVMSGDNYKIKIVLKNSPAVFSTMMVDEIAQMISDIVINTQKGVYGYRSYTYETDKYDDVRWDKIEEINLDFIEQVLKRESFYDVEYLGVSNALPFVEYYFMAFTILLLMLCSIVCVNLLVKNDLSLERSLLSQGHGLFRQIIGDFLPFFGIISVNLLLIFVGLGALSQSGMLGDEFFSHLYGVQDYLLVGLAMLPTVAVICGMHFFLYELTSNVVSAVLLQTLALIGLSYVSGFLYPLYSLPVVFQKISVFLPTGVAFNYGASVMSDSGEVRAYIPLLYCCLFVALSAIVRKIKIRGSRI